MKLWIDIGIAVGLLVVWGFLILLLSLCLGGQARVNRIAGPRRHGRRSTRLNQAMSAMSFGHAIYKAVAFAILSGRIR